MLFGHYRQLVSLRKLKRDPAQEGAVRKLGLLAKSFNSKPAFAIFRPKAMPAKGLYIWGDVGRGKTLLMDMFFESVRITQKRRTHFNSFMVDVHARIHAQRQSSSNNGDPILPVAKSLAQEARLLCFDELQVNDVADALILGRLFEGLLEDGVTIVATSNIPPQKLYEGGLNRQLFLPFIEQICQRLDIVEVNGPTDYRLERMSSLDVYITPLGAQADKAMQAAWQKLTDGSRSRGGQLEPVQLKVLGRIFEIRQARDGVARFDFAELCIEPLGAADYLALAQSYHTLLIDHIPQLRLEDRDPVRRFILLIDTLYDQAVKLICSAAVPAHELLRYQQMESEEDLAKAFRRTVSRLVEMQSQDYLECPRRTSMKESTAVGGGDPTAAEGPILEQTMWGE